MASDKFFCPLRTALVCHGPRARRFVLADATACDAAAGFLARIFIIFHDCGHASFFKSKRANSVMGAIAGLVNLTPFRHWRWQHALHHGIRGRSGSPWLGRYLDADGEEYLQSTRWRRLTYRLARNPIVLFVIAPLYVFVVHHRLAASDAPDRERRSVWRTNWALLGIMLVMNAVIGLKAFLMIQLTVSAFAGAVGLWLFYVQHQFEAPIGRGPRTGITPRRRLRAVHFMSCRESCSGSPVTSGSIISTT